MSEYALRDLSLVFFTTLLIVFMCRVAHPASHDMDTQGAVHMTKLAQETSAVDRALPPIDQIVPNNTETATFALG
jgi:hypothetical protein